MLLGREAVNGAGVVGVASSTFTTDITAPVAPTIESAPASPSSSATATFAFTNSEAGVGFECRLDGSAWAACVSPRSYTALAEGSRTFEVRSVDAVGNPSPVTTRTWVVDTVAPGAAITFPANGVSYHQAGYTGGCGTASTGDVCGTASDTGGTGVSRVQVSLQQGSGSYWNGTGFTSSSEVLLDATGTTSWTHAFSASSFPADGQYTLRARVTDGAGNTTTGTSTFTVDVTAPRGVDVQTANGTGGTAGQIDNSGGDSITLTYSERISPASILAGWDGTTSQIVTVRVNEGPARANDTLTIWNSGDTSQLPLGTVNLGGADYTTSDFVYSSSTMTQNGADIKIVLGTRKGAGNDTSRTTTTMTWTPSPVATDLLGNPTDITPVTESGAADKEF